MLHTTLQQVIIDQNPTGVPRVIFIFKDGTHFVASIGRLSATHREGRVFTRYILGGYNSGNLLVVSQSHVVWEFPNGARQRRKITDQQQEGGATFLIVR